MLAFVGSPAGAAGNTKSTGGFPDGTPCDPGCKAGPIYGKLGAWVSSAGADTVHPRSAQLLAATCDAVRPHINLVRSGIDIRPFVQRRIVGIAAVHDIRLVQTVIGACFRRLTTKPCKSAAPSIRRRSTAPAPRRVQPSCLAGTPVATSGLEVNASGAPKQHTN